MKTEFRMYNHERGARFRSGPKEIILQRLDNFQLTTYEGKPAVIKDGIVYGVKKSLIKELRARSTTQTPNEYYKSRVDFLNQFGLDIEKALVKNLKKWTTPGFKHGYRNDRVFIRWNERTTLGDVTVLFQITNTVCGVSVFGPTRESLKIENLSVYKQQAEKFVRYLKTKYSLRFLPFKESSAKLGGVGMVGSNSTFSGFTYSYLTQWVV